MAHRDDGDGHGVARDVEGLVLGLSSGISDLTATLPFERARLVRLCAQMTGDADAAEDLAQETLIEAWRNAHKLRDPAGRAPWLAAIARNVCHRWTRRRGREITHLLRSRPADDAEATEGPGMASANRPENVADEFDLELELERDELAQLLDRAMALLPDEARHVLVEHLVAETPQTEIALRLGLSQGAVAMRLHRGKLALRRILSTQLWREAVSYGLIDGLDAGWQQTRHWCLYCGQQRLLGRFSPGHEVMQLRCSRCDYTTYSQQSPRTDFRWDDVKGFRATNARIAAWHRRHFLPGVEQRVVSCAGCGRPTPLQVFPLHPPTMRPLLALEMSCRACGGIGIGSEADTIRYGGRPLEMSFRACGGIGKTNLEWLILCLPEGQRFTRAHPRIRLVGTNRIETDGEPALVTSYESVTGGATFTVVSAADSLRIVRVRATGHAETT